MMIANPCGILQRLNYTPLNYYILFHHEKSIFDIKFA